MPEKNRFERVGAGNPAAGGGIFPTAAETRTASRLPLKSALRQLEGGSLGFVLMGMGLGLGVTMIVLPVGVVIGLMDSRSSFWRNSPDTRQGSCVSARRQQEVRS
jgi:hypothetical protein